MSVELIAPQGAIKRNDDVIDYWSYEIVNLERVETIRRFTHRSLHEGDSAINSIVFSFGHSLEHSGQVAASWDYPSKEARDADLKRVIELVDSSLELD